MRRAGPLARPLPAATGCPPIPRLLAQFATDADSFSSARIEARVVAAIDRREELALLPLADDEADRLLESVPEEARDDCWWLVLRDGTPNPGDAGGGVALFAQVWPTRPLARALERCTPRRSSTRSTRS